ncbi:gluconate 5-dehydrogenase [Salana multivorans]|uniref:Gluconate 5-dehydrogenase n=1 Tax=Salana multivorans TaxID=120377 RepID=A0A3N2DE90_9MICO|nr:glucose 1-dehydrogenase [Salana multivorans]ROR97744.1 gluconate 5-dehydrogenase [Salana multivorans]
MTTTLSSAAPSPFDITGRTALVTGSSRGIGLTFARGLASSGARVAVHGIDAAETEAAAAALADETGAQVHAVTFDVTDAAAVRAGVADVEAALGSIDILVNNAGIQRRHPLVEFPESDLDAILAVNLKAPFLVAQRVAVGMIARGSGKIVNTASVQSQLARPSITPYSASKGGIVMLTRGLCADLAAHGIQVNALAPGYIETDLTRALVKDEAFSAWVTGRTPAARWGQVEDLVGTLLYLVSPAADFVNGQTIFVDGGMTAVV